MPVNYAVEYKGCVLKRRFKGMDEAQKWAAENYKGGAKVRGWRVVSSSEIAAMGRRAMKLLPTDKEMTAAAGVMNEHGLAINLPWEGDLDDVERERFEALRDAIAAVLKIRLS